MRSFMRFSLVAAAAAATAVALFGVGSPAQARNASAALVWSPTTAPGSYDFGTVQSGGSSPQRFRLTNTGGQATARLKISLSGSPAFSAAAHNCNQKRLSPGRSCRVVVTYAPTLDGQSDTGTLVANAGRLSASLALTGTGGPGGAADLRLRPGTLAGTVDGKKTYFRELGAVVAGTNMTWKFTVTNNGSAASQTLTLLPPDQEQYALTADGCTSKALGPGDKCTFDVALSVPADCADFQPGTNVRIEGTAVAYIELDLQASSCSPSG